MLKETLREKVFVHSLPELFNGVLAKLETAGQIVSDKDIVRLAAHSRELSDEDSKLKQQFEDIYLASGVEAPSLDELMEKAAVPVTKRTQGRKVLQLLIDSKQIVRVQNEMFLHADVIEDLKSRLSKYAAEHEPERLIDVAGFKELAGVSRKYAIPLLEFFDRERVTRRAGDKRLILK
jgi:selenocysteine-specific elongation factor